MHKSTHGSRRGFIKGGMAIAAAAAALPSFAAAAGTGAAAGDPADGVAADAIPSTARTAIEDLLEHGAHQRRGQKVLLAAYLDGLHGGDNLVDRTAIEWIRRIAVERGAQVEVLWVDAPARIHQWAFPDALRAAMDRNDLTINHAFDLTVEEILAFRQYVEEDNHKPMVRNFATTAPLLCSAWAQTPQELVSEIRYRASTRIVAGRRWTLSDPNGTQLEGTVQPARNPTLGYATRRESGNYLPWPEWVCPPISLADTQGTFVFDRTLSWWSRYIGINPWFATPVTLTIRDGRIVAIEGGEEAAAIRRFMDDLQRRLGDATYAFDTLHFGVHPQAHVAPQQCANPLYRRLIEHSHSRNLHVHLGSPAGNASYPYWPHITGDVRDATFRIGEQSVYERGHLSALDDPQVLAVAARYPGRPGLGPEPFIG